jgi:3-oxoacyl-[acyl-carrier-protein] synthase III
MIQEDVGANLGHPPIGGHGTFSFDVAAGTCGPMAAMQIIDGFVRSGIVRHGLVVASDTHPGRGHAREFPYSPTGAAALLSATPGAVGFSRFTTELFPEHAGDLRAEVHWEPAHRRAPWSAPGRNVLVLERSEDFADHAIAGALAVAERTLDQQGLGPEDVSVIITPDAGGIGRAVVRGLGRPGVVAGDGAHTAAVLVALAQARDEGRLDEGRALVLTVSAGLHVSCAVHAR